ncbi:MAG: hypothetical protein JF609_08785 [Verrucomicrobia bacterium]|nr:hypothetical protein [Verrucomicrobiota bacterium]
MKKSKWFIMAAATLISQVIAVQSGSAQDSFKVVVDAISISTNHAGALVYHEFDNHDIIRNCAAEQGITNLTGLSLVYNRTADAVQVVTKTNGTVICTPLSFSDGVTLSNTNDTKIQRLANVFWENSSVSGGTLLAGEWISYGPTNQIKSYLLKGQLQFSVPGTNGITIYAGNIYAISPLPLFGRHDD